MLKYIKRFFSEFAREVKLESYEAQLRKYDLKRSALKAKAMIVQRKYDELRAQK